jgi:O-antigen ligase
VQTHSRTALILGPLALVSSLLLLQRVGVNRTIVWSTAAVSLILLAVAIEAVGSDTVARFDNSADLSLRWHIHATTLEAARHFGVWGSGLGTFVQAYQQVKPVEGILPAYVNHAHSDYHELWLETGVPGVAVVLFFFIWFGHATWRAWRPGSRSAASMLISRAAAISIVMALMHSFLDYPLRKTAILVVFGMVCALISRSEEVKDSRRVAISRLQPQQQPREQTA